MKRFLIVPLCSALALSVLSTGFTLNKTQNENIDQDHAVIISQPSPIVKQDSYATVGLSLIEKMDKLAESEKYISLLSASENLNKLITKIGNANYSDPKAIYKSLIPEGAIIDDIVSDDTSVSSSDNSLIVEKKLIISLPNQINAASGSLELAASALLSADDSILDASVTEPEIYLYLYDGDYSAFVTLIPGSDGTVSTTARFIKTEQLNNISSAEDLTKFFEDSLLLKGLDFKEVSI